MTTEFSSISPYFQNGICLYYYLQNHQDPDWRKQAVHMCSDSSSLILSRKVACKKIRAFSCYGIRKREVLRFSFCSSLKLILNIRFRYFWSLPRSLSQSGVQLGCESGNVSSMSPTSCSSTTTSTTTHHHATMILVKLKLLHIRIKCKCMYSRNQNIAQDTSHFASWCGVIDW